MNEVRTTPMPTPVVQRAASSKGSDGVNAPIKEEMEAKLPETQIEPITAAAPVDKKEEVDIDIEHAVTEMNDYVQKVHRDLQFSLDEDLGMTIVKVVDMGTGDLIRQIPEEVFLNLARNLKEDQPLQLFDAMG